MSYFISSIWQKKYKKAKSLNQIGSCYTETIASEWQRIKYEKRQSLYHCGKLSRGLNYYQEVLGGEIKNVQLADDVEMFKGHEGKCLHAELHLGNSIIHFSDPFGRVEKGDHVKITIEFDSEEEIRKVYQSLVADGQAILELQDTFWGALHANVIDKYGIGWLLNYQK